MNKYQQDSDALKGYIGRLNRLGQTCAAIIQQDANDDNSFKTTCLVVDLSKTPNNGQYHVLGQGNTLEEALKMAESTPNFNSTPKYKGKLANCVTLALQIVSLSFILGLSVAVGQGVSKLLLALGLSSNLAPCLAILASIGTALFLLYIFDFKCNFLFKSKSDSKLPPFPKP